jgi:hypothetical protein
MSDEEVTYETHPVWTNVARIKDYVDNFNPSSLLPEEAYGDSELARQAETDIHIQEIRKIVTYVYNLNKLATSYLVPMNALQELENATRPCLKYINEKPHEFEDDTNDYLSFRIRKWKQVSNSIRNLKNYISPWSLGIIESSETFEQLNDSYMTLISLGQNKLSSNFDRSLEDMQERFNLVKEEIDRELLHAQITMNHLIDTSLDKTPELITNAKQLIVDGKLEFETTLKKAKTDLNLSVKNYNELAQTKLATVTADQYRKHARNERGIGMMSTSLGLAILSAGALLIGFAPGNILSDQALSGNFWEHFYLRLSLTILLSAIATVCIRFGSRSMYRGNEYKRQHLELASLFALVREDDSMTAREKQLVNQAKLDFFNRSYGRTWNENNAKSAEDDLGSGELIKILAEALSNRNRGN